MLPRQLRSVYPQQRTGPPHPVRLSLIRNDRCSNRYAGQFFTPQQLCKMMAQLTVAPTKEPVTIADPACGSGRFFIAAMPLAPNATFYGTSRDLTCVNMTALNMLTRNANAFVVHANTLSMECFGGYVTRSTALGGIISPLDATTARSILTATANAITGAQPAVVKSPEPAQPQTSDGPQAAASNSANHKGQLGFDS